MLAVPTKSLRIILSSVTVCVALFLCFWRLGDVPVAEWDEARYGANAVEMVRTGDYINYYYKGALDFWNAKPPLQVWAIALSNQFFGENEFSMRFPSAVGALVSFAFLFLIGRDIGGFNLGLAFVWGAMCTRAIVGYHVGRSGDMDALFVAGLAISDFYLRRLFRGTARWGWVGVALGLLLAFFSKGFALLLVVPGYAIVFFLNRWKDFLTSRQFWAGLGVLAVGIGIWLSVLSHYGAEDTSKQYSASNAVGVMIFYDIFVRFAVGLDVKDGRDPRIILAFLDTRFGAFYYATVLLGIAYFILRRKKLLDPSKTFFFKCPFQRKKEWTYSWVMLASVLLILGVSQNKLNWYVAPLAIWLPCFALAMAEGVAGVSAKAKKITFSFLGIVLLVNMIHVIRSIHAGSQAPSPIQKFVRENKEQLREVAVLKTPRPLRQDEYLYLLWSVGGKIESSDGGLQYPKGYRLDCGPSKTCSLVSIVD